MTAHGHARTASGHCPDLTWHCWRGDDGIEWGPSVWGKRRSGGQEHPPTITTDRRQTAGQTRRHADRPTEGRKVWGWGRRACRYLPCTPCTLDPAHMHLGLHLHPSSQPADAPQWLPPPPRCCRADGLGWLGWHRVSIDFAQSAAGAAPDRYQDGISAPAAVKLQASMLGRPRRHPPPNRNRPAKPDVCISATLCVLTCVTACVRGKG